MAKILDFVRRPAAPPREPGVARLLEDFSIEVMPRTAAKIEDFRAILPAGTRIYLAHIDGTDFADMRATARRLTDEGFAVMPHFPARGIASRAELESRIAAYADVGVTEALVIAGGIADPARPLRRGAAPAAHRPVRRPRLHPPARRRPPGRQPRHRSAGRRRPRARRPRRQGRLRPRDRRRDGDRHPVLLRDRPGDRLDRAAARGRHRAPRPSSASPARPGSRPCSSSRWPAASAPRCGSSSAAPPT